MSRHHDKNPSADDELASVSYRGLDPEQMGILDMESLNPEFYYRFVQERPQRIARMKARGGRIVSASEDGVKTFIEDDTPADDKIRDGDTILMRFPREKHEESRRKVRKITRGRLATPEANFRKKAKGAAPGGEDVQVITTKEPKEIR